MAGWYPEQILFSRNIDLHYGLATKLLNSSSWPSGVLF